MINKLKNKYVFFDVDGTLAEYRFNNMIYSSKRPELGGQTLEELLFSDIFRKSRPLKNMQKLIGNLDTNKIFILGTIVTNKEAEQKYIWLAENYPNIKRENIFFISSTMLKPEVIIEYCKHYNIDLKEACFVDDRLDVLRKAEELGITSYHPSSFVD